MTEQEVMKVFEDTGCFIKGHFVFSHGEHSDIFLDGERTSRDPRIASALGLEIAKRFQDEGIGVVIGPKTGGIVPSQWVAYHLGLLIDRKIMSLYTEKRGNAHSLRIGDRELVNRQRVLVVDDVATTWSTVVKTAQAVMDHGGSVVGGAVYWQRKTDVMPDTAIVPRVEALVRRILTSSSSEDECELCKKCIEINTDYGHGANFLKSKY